MKRKADENVVYSSTTHVLFGDGTVKRIPGMACEHPLEFWYSLDLISAGLYRLSSVGAKDAKMPSSNVNCDVTPFSGTLSICRIPQIIRTIQHKAGRALLEESALLLFLITTPVVYVGKLHGEILVRVSLPEYTPSAEPRMPMCLNEAEFPRGAYARLFVRAAEKTGYDIEDPDVYLMESHIPIAISEIDGVIPASSSDVADRLRAVRAALAVYQQSAPPPVRIIDLPYFVSAVRLHTDDAVVNDVIVPALLNGAPLPADVCLNCKHGVVFVRALLHFVVESTVPVPPDRLLLAQRILNIM